MTFSPGTKSDPRERQEEKKRLVCSSRIWARSEDWRLFVALHADTEILIMSTLSMPTQHSQNRFTCNLPMCYFLLPLALLSAAHISAADAVPDASLQEATGYCESTGGDVIYREAVYGTNGDMSTWLHLANVHGFCEYTSAQDGSHISVFLDTLRTKKPTLATLAYYAKVQPQSPNNGSNPASFYCSQLGGSDLFGGVGSAGVVGSATAPTTKSFRLVSFPISPRSIPSACFIIQWELSGELT